MTIVTNDNMTEKQYSLLCNACDRILLDGIERMERVAISWLHVIREHPSLLSQYSSLFEEEKCHHSIVKRIFRSAAELLSRLKHLSGSLVRDRHHWYGDFLSKVPVDILFVSHLINASHVGKEDDFYFSSLPLELAAHGTKTAIALINHSGGNPRNLAGGWRSATVPRVVFSRTIGFLKEMALHARLKKESRLLLHQTKTTTDDFRRHLLFRAAREALSRETHFTLRLSRQIENLVAALQPKIVVTTFEGHAWERVVFSASRAVIPHIRCVAYQHAALFRLQHAIKRPLSASYDPELIFTAGKVASRQFLSQSGFHDVRIEILGSNRAYRVSQNELTIIQSPTNRSACLVIPEGFPDECNILFSFSVACAKACPTLPFIWRLHPVVSWSSLRSRNSLYENLPDNICLSDSSLEKDLSACSWALYRGTTAIVQAVMAGLRPLYVSLPDELTIDPLYEMDAYRAYVSTAADFNRLVTASPRNQSIPRTVHQAAAQEYCQGFFTPLNISRFEAAMRQWIEHS